jgi:type II secretory pathway pseudopilin PulG
MRRAKRRVGAYTFAEVLIAAGILGFVAASLYIAFSAGFCLIQSTRENLRATQIMVQKLEAIRLFTWTQVNDTTNYLKPTFSEVYDPLGTTNNNGARYSGTLTASVPAVGELPDAYRTNMRTITVGLSWTNYSGSRPIAHQRTMTTRVAQNGMQNYIWGKQ